MIGGIIAKFPYIFYEGLVILKPVHPPKESTVEQVYFGVRIFFATAIFGYYLLASFTFNFLVSLTLEIY